MKAVVELPSFTPSHATDLGAPAPDGAVTVAYPGDLAAAPPLVTAPRPGRGRRIAMWAAAAVAARSARDLARRAGLGSRAAGAGTGSGSRGFGARAAPGRGSGDGRTGAGRAARGRRARADPGDRRAGQRADRRGSIGTRASRRGGGGAPCHGAARAAAVPGGLRRHAAHTRGRPRPPRPPRRPRRRPRRDSAETCPLGSRLPDPTTMKHHPRLLVLLLALASAPALADEASDHADRATRAYNLQDWNTALAEYRKAYQLDPKPETLWAIAQTQRLSGDCRSAVLTYKAYIRGASAAGANAAEAWVHKCDGDAGRATEGDRGSDHAGAGETAGRGDGGAAATARTPGRGPRQAAAAAPPPLPGARPPR